MKVALISLARRGGMVHFLAELANGLASICEVVVVRSAGSDASYFAGNIRQTLVNTGNGKLGGLLQSLNPIGWVRLLLSLAAIEGDVIHITGVHPWNPAIAIMAKVLRKPLVYTLHDANPHPGAPWLMTIADRVSSRLAEVIIVLTREARSQAVARGLPRRRTRVIAHPIYTLFRRWRPKNARPTKTILHIGRLEGYKGLEQLVQAFQVARRSLPGWGLVIAGSGRLPAGVAAGASIRIKSEYISDRELARLAYRAGIIALPYTSATQSGVAALALAVGCPVVASDVGGLREMLINGRSGLLVKPGDVRALTGALVALAGNANRLHRMRTFIARQETQAPGLPERVALSHLRTYRQVLRK